MLSQKSRSMVLISCTEVWACPNRMWYTVRWLLIPPVRCHMAGHQVLVIRDRQFYNSAFMTGFGGEASTKLIAFFLVHKAVWYCGQLLDRHLQLWFSEWMSAWVSVLRIEVQWVQPKLGRQISVECIPPKIVSGQGRNSPGQLQSWTSLSLMDC